MSNGLTDVFMDVLALNTSALAGSEDEKRLAVWLAQHNQSFLGAGTVGFDIQDMPWSESDFERQKDFLIRGIQAAKTKRLWEKLPYEPLADHVMDVLSRFRLLLEAFQKADVDPAVLRA